MSALVFSACAGSTNNPVFSLTNQFFQDAGIASSSWNTLKTGQRKDTTNSFRSTSNFEEAWQEGNSNGTIKFDDWNQFIQQSEIGNDWYATEFMLSDQAMEDEEEEFRQEWSDEQFTELYVKKHGLDKIHDNNNIHSHARTRYSQENSFTQEFLESNIYRDNNITTYITQHNDLFQAQLYLLDHLLFNVLSYPLPITCRPSPKAEWDWARLFSSSRWYEKEDEDDKIPQDKYLKDVASRRLQLLFGHLGVGAGNRSGDSEDGNLNFMDHEIRVAL